MFPRENGGPESGNAPAVTPGLPLSREHWSGHGRGSNSSRSRSRRSVGSSVKHSAIRPTAAAAATRSEEHTSELQSLMRISYAVFCLKKKKNHRSTPALTCNTYMHQEPCAHLNNIEQTTNHN